MIGRLIDDIFLNYNNRILDFIRTRDVIDNQEAIFRQQAQVFGLMMASRIGFPFPAKTAEKNVLLG